MIKSLICLTATPVPAHWPRAIAIWAACSSLIACQSAVTPDPEPASQPVSAEVAPVQSVPLQAEPSSAESITRPEQAGLPEFNSLWERIRHGFQLQDFYQHPRVEAQLVSYRNNQQYFDLVSARAAPYLFGIVNEIEDRGLPMEFALLPAIESTFNAAAHSSQNAVGLWQILANTGSSLGLQQDWWYDARRDPLPATIAALDYLQALYLQFDQDWLLTLAAYNTGPANVARARNRQQEKSSGFWNLALAPETRNHVPRLLALSRVVAAPAQYGIQLGKLANHSPVARVEIGSQIDLAHIARLLRMEEAELRALNPGYLQWATHPQSPQSVTVPADKTDLLRTGLASLDSSEYVSWEHYRVRSGDTLGGIALRLRTTVDVLQKVNRLQGTRIIAGASLLIPRGSGATNPDALRAPPLPADPVQAVPDSYVVQAGDNLWLIARRFDLRSSEIIAWNGIELDALLHPGQQLDLSFAQRNTVALNADSNSTVSGYTVVRGDSPARIAQMFGLDLAEFLRWNGLDANSIIYPGQVLNLKP